MYVGVIDEGIDVSHPDLAANVWQNPYDPVNGRRLYVNGARVANVGDVQSMDPHSLNETLQLSFTSSVYEALVGRDQKMALTPLLALFLTFFWLYNIIDAGRRAALDVEAPRAVEQRSGADSRTMRQRQPDRLDAKPVLQPRDRQRNACAPRAQATNGRARRPAATGAAGDSSEVPSHAPGDRTSART